MGGPGFPYYFPDGEELDLTVGVRMDTVNLAQAIGGDGDLTYSWTPAPPAGLELLQGPRTPSGAVPYIQLKGTPTEAQARTVYTYAATDNVADAATLTYYITIASAGAPGRVEAPTLRAGDRTLDVTWTAPEDAGTSALTGYGVRYKSTAGHVEAWTAHDHSGTDAATTLTELDNGTEYEVRVRAVNDSGGGAWSPSATATPEATDAGPSARTLGAAAAADCGGADIWCTTLTAGDDGGDASYGYYSLPSSPSSEFGSVEGNAFDLADSMFSVSELYWFKLGAELNLSVDQLSLSSAVQAQIQALDLHIGDKTFALAEATVADFANKSTLTLSVTDNPFVSGQTYTVRLTGATPATVPKAPADLTATGGEGEVTLSWTAGADGGSAITGHEYQQKAGSEADGEWTPIANSAPGKANATSYTVTGLTNATTYRFKVRAVNNMGDGAESNEANATPSATNRASVFSAATDTRSIAENTATGQNIGGVLTATDADGDTVTYTLGGTDGASFGIVAASGQVQTKAALNFETRSSYTVTVTATEDPSSAPPASITVTITVTNVNEAGTVRFDSTGPVVGTALTALVSDPDGGVTGMAWQWASAAASAGPFTTISGATAGAYTPVAGNEGSYLRATASYTDDEGSGKNASVVTGAAVAAAADTAPAFSNAPVAAQSYTVGVAISSRLPEATGGDGDLTYSVEPGWPSGLAVVESELEGADTRDLEGTPTTSQAATTYTWTVADSDNNTELSDERSITFSIVIAPGRAPTPTAEVGDGQVTLSWSQPSDRGITGWEVQQDSGPWAAIMPTEAEAGGTLTLSHVVRGLTNGTPYTFQIRAVTQGDDGQVVSSAASASVSATPVAAALVSKAELQLALSAFGRVVATDAVAVIGQRMTGANPAQTQVTVGGVDVTRLATLVQPQFPGLSAGARAGRGVALGAFGVLRQSGRDVLAGSAFALSLGDTVDPLLAGWSVWGRGQSTHFQNQAGGGTVDGEMLTGYLGVDGHLTATTQVGLAVSRSQGDLASQGEASRSDMELSLTTVLPYVRWQPSPALSVWGLGGIGFGELAVTTEDAQVAETDVGLRLGALGLEQQLASHLGINWAVKADTFAVQMDTEAVESLPAVEADVTRLRLAVVGTGVWTEADARWAPSVEVGLRLDDGTGVQGLGMEVGTGLGYTHLRLGLTVEARARVVVAHEADGFEEWGAGGTVRYDPGQPGEGVQLTLTPQWGVTSSGVEALWSRRASGLRPGLGTPAGSAGQLVAEVSYGGLRLSEAAVWLRPFTRLVLAAEGHRMSAGTRIGTPVADLSLVGERETAGRGAVHHSLRLQWDWRF